MITEPTRVTTASVTLIDHIYTTNPENFIDIKVPYYAISDDGSIDDFLFEIFIPNRRTIRWSINKAD
jgi:hypothetical protein